MENIQLKLQHTLKGHNGAIYDVISSGNYLYTTSADKFVVRWDVNKRIQDNFTIKLEHTSFSLAIDQKGETLVIGNSKGGLHCIDLKSKKETRYLTQHKAPIFAITHDAANDVFYSGDGDGYFCVWEAKSMKLLLTFPLNCGKIRQISLDENSEHLAVCGQDGKFRIFETNFFNEIECLSVNKDGVNTAVFYDDQLITGGKDAMMSIWEWRSRKLIQSIPAHNYAIYDLSILKEKSRLISVSFDKTIKCWSLPEFDVLERIEFKNQGHRHTVNRIAKLSENQFATVSDDATIKIWSLD